MRVSLRPTAACTCGSAAARGSSPTRPTRPTGSCSSTQTSRWATPACGARSSRRSVAALSSQYPDLYNNDNIALVSTHQHSGVGGYLEDLLPQITSLGYVKQTADAIVAGTVLAVQRAHNSLAPGSLSLGNTSVVDGNRNRSPSAYLANPAEERARYEYDQDKDLTLLRFDDASGSARGFLSFYAVHGTSIYEVCGRERNTTCADRPPEQYAGEQRQQGHGRVPVRAFGRTGLHAWKQHVRRRFYAVYVA